HVKPTASAGRSRATKRFGLPTVGVHRRTKQETHCAPPSGSKQPARLRRVELFCLRRCLDFDPARLSAFAQRQDEFEHAMAIRRLNVLRVDVFGQRELTLEPSITDFADNRL